MLTLNHDTHKLKEIRKFTYPKAGSFLSAFLCILMRLIEVDLLFIGGCLSSGGFPGKSLCF
jgi:hypothetical protein